MRKKVLINGITLDKANLTPLLLKIRTWQEEGVFIDIFCNKHTKKRIDESGLIESYGFIDLKNTKKINGKFNFIFESLKRNFLALFYVNKIRNKYDVIYSISSVLDLTIFPFIIKKVDKKIKWVAVFDNIVPFSDPGNKLVRFLGWLFFKISLLFLKSTDSLFAISKELKEYLLRKGFGEDKIIVTGNAVESDLIKKSKRSEYKFDAIFVGRINETKGIYDMLKVLKEVKKTHNNFLLAIMGEGDEITKNNFIKKINQLKLDSNVILLGYRTGIEKFNLIKNSKCFLFLSTSAHESFGVALLEAVCCGLYSFAYDLKPFRSIYKNNEVFISPKNNWKLVSKKILDLFKKNDFINKKGLLLIEKYSWKEIAKKELIHF